MTQPTGLIPDELLGNVNENDGGAVRLTVRSLATGLQSDVNPNQFSCGFNCPACCGFCSGAPNGRSTM